ncbi:protein unc-13 homolog [Ziziphus jujuba]|uniref:Protein unc-13 homolog n=1 Tax=Ziziphus jujuba TaxID=326968 RepID=A0A6P4AQ20_ZIZJJ|nr:protein unc-13 homolog [Ziziphus jujuba]
MANILRDRVFGSSRRHQRQPTQTTMPVYPVEDVPSPFGDLGLNISNSELRETAYEILVGACRSSGGKPLTYIPQSERTDRAAVAPNPSPSLQRSLTSTAASRVKKALGLKPSSNSRKQNEGENQGRTKRSVTVGEMIRVQMRVTEQTDTRIRRALLRVAAGQLGRRIESMVLPLELLQQFKSSDFANQQENEAWQRRNLKILEAGLLLHPYVPLDKTDTNTKRLQQIIQGALEKPIETGRNSETIQVLRSVVMSLSCRSFDGSISETCHWADGVPLNLKLYQMLLESCFDVNDETCVIEEVDEVLELLKKTWVILGINQMLHDLCFSWVLFHRYVTVGQIENDLLMASTNLLAEVEKDAKPAKDPIYSKILSSTLSSMVDWAEKRLLSYRDIFHSDNIESLQSIVYLAVLAAKILVEEIPQRKRKEVDAGYDRVEKYIRSSLRIAFAQKLEKVKSKRRLSKNQNNRLPVLSILAQDASELAFSEKAIFSPVFKRWHPLAAGVGVATLHSCYGNELKQFVAGISELTPSTIEVLRAADKLEKDLVQIAVEDSVDSDDGGKSVIREMLPYEAEAVIANLVKAWIKTRVDRLKEWVDRNLQQEVWNPHANKEHFAPSAVEVLRIIDETLEAFFMLPIPMHSIVLPELMNGLDRCVQHYVLQIKSGCGTPSTFIPTMPSLTRCSAGSKFHGVFKKKEKSQISQRRKSQAGATTGDNSFGIAQLCVRINTLQIIRMELGVFEKRAIANIGSLESNHVDNIANGWGKMFELSASACVEGIQQICEATAYKIIFHDLSHVLWDGLYVGEVSTSRIEPFLQELEQYLEIISSTVHDRVRTRFITDVMRASFDGFLLILLAGGPSRAFTQHDSDIIEEDFKFLTELFWSNGDGLPLELIDKFSTIVKNVLPLYHTDTESLIEQFKCVTLENYGSSAKSRLPLPQTTGQWNPTEPNTLLRVLCYRNDEAAAKFLKKNYNLPKKL